ncbi:serine/threonine-protein kinase LATS1 [Galendromus occidentalis]|uniref:non-specific serine/threonine protein kinase n=1 Tax=Galendromus occidentalis TaxID=34638 RepID=A0AAJ7L7N1_9ACAR|nr:serine/threonine-protein kinase LATS1 [Galendromus occidentalis]
MPRPLPALPGAEPPDRERPSSAASNASPHAKENTAYRMMALQQIRNSLEPFANQQELPTQSHHVMKRSEMSSASSTTSESSYGYSAFSALPPKTPGRPPELVQRSQSCGPRKPPARLPPEQPSLAGDHLTNGAVALQQQRVANQNALMGLKALRISSKTLDPTGTPLWEKMTPSGSLSDSGVESSPTVRSILPDPPRLLQSPDYYQPPAPQLYPKNPPAEPPPPPPRPDRNVCPSIAPPPIHGPKPAAKKYPAPQREPPPPYSIYSPPSICSNYSGVSYVSSSFSGGRLSPTNTMSSSECSNPNLPRRTPPPHPPVSPQPSVCSSVSLGSSSMSSSKNLPPQQAASWAVKKAKSQSPVIMHSVKATPIQKPVPQTAIAPPSRPVPPVPTQGYSTPPPYPCPPPVYHRRIQQPHSGPTPPPLPPPRSGSPPSGNSQHSTNHAPSPSPSSVASMPTSEPPSYASSVAAIAAQKVPPTRGPTSDLVTTVASICQSQVSALQGTNHSQDNTNVDSSSSRSESPVTESFSVGGGVCGQLGENKEESDEPIRHQSPIPEVEWTAEREESKVRNYSPDAYKFFMEQHVENVMKNHQQRQHRRQQLETEMAKVGLSRDAQLQMRKMLYQKESNYIRLRRAKMEHNMFKKIAIIGMGAFGEVALVKKIDSQQLYAMKTLRKEDVLKRNQVAHVKAERDILAEADNEWVVKLYYSFQDDKCLYFVMDYIAGGDMMTLLIKKEIFEESLARFYIAELTCALESVHKLGFIHRDIKPDNILIDRDGHIKLTDFGLCTGFRWTHNSKYYQRNGSHARQDSMDFHVCDDESCACRKPLALRRRKDQQRCLAQSLVGTPNYIAPEVLLREGYNQACDWWSVGVILYEMLVGQPPFLANAPQETQLKVINWQKHLSFPPAAKLSMDATKLILALLTSQEKRLGAKGADEIKKHPFFKGIDFDGDLRKTTAPHIPDIRYPADTANFDYFEMPKSSTDDGASNGVNGKCRPGDRDGEHAFLEFTFRRFFDDGGQAYPLRFGRQSQEEQETPQVDSQGNPVYV